MSGIHVRIPAHMESHVRYVWIPDFAGMILVSHPTSVGFRSCWNPEHVTTYMNYLKRTHLFRRNSAPEISSNVLGLQRFARRKAAKRPAGTAGKTNPFLLTQYGPWNCIQLIRTPSLPSLPRREAPRESPTPSWFGRGAPRFRA